MNVRSEIHFDEDRGPASLAIETIGDGKGWCNVVPLVSEDVPDLRVNFLGLWSNRGVVMSSFITVAPRHDQAQASSLGVLHSRGRLGRERIESMILGAPFRIRQDHNQRGLLLDVPAGTSSVSCLT